MQEVFEFVDGLCDLRIAPLKDAVFTPETAISDSGIIAGSTGFLDEKPQLSLSPAALTPTTTLPAPKPNLDRADDGETKGPKATLRIDLDRVDRPINAVGELIINQTIIAQRLQDMTSTRNDDLVMHIEDYRLLARDIQESVMAIRAQPVKSLFQRISRILREAADATGKLAELVTVVVRTEVEKTVVERLADPLSHMIRNAVDHGLESRKARAAAGKPAMGTIRLSASHRSGSVIIKINDDGAGLDRPKILEIAKRKGLVPPDADLNDTEIDQLLFLPGLSIAAALPNLSGRGVGLDAVRNAVQAWGVGSLSPRRRVLAPNSPSCCH